jgi:hypothetical protein
MMKHVTIFGVGSSLDRMLLQSVKMAAAELNMPIDIEIINDIEAFVRQGVGAIPAMAIEDEVIVNGRVPSVTEIKTLLREQVV